MRLPAVVVALFLSIGLIGLVACSSINTSGPNLRGPSATVGSSGKVHSSGPGVTNPRVSGPGGTSVTADANGAARDAGNSVSGSNSNNNSNRSNTSSNTSNRSNSGGSTASNSASNTNSGSGSTATQTAAFGTGRDLYVSMDGGAKDGDGSKANPMRNLSVAMEQAKDGDTIHVAAGRYNGKYNGGLFRITAQYVRVHGGYNADFSARSPWSTPTVVGWKRVDGDRAPNDTVLVAGNNNAQCNGFELDGIVLDGGDRNNYYEGDVASLNPRGSATYPLMTAVIGPGGKLVIRDCLFINAGYTCAMMLAGNPGAETTIDNCVFANNVGMHLEVNGRNCKPGTKRATFNFSNCTFAFLYNRGSTGQALVARAYATVNLDHCIFAHVESEAISSVNYEYNTSNDAVPNEFISVDNCVFHDTMEGMLRWIRPGSSAYMRTTEVSDLGDTTLRSAKSNSSDDPGLDYDSTYISLFRARYAEEAPETPEATDPPANADTPPDNAGGEGDFDFEFDFGGDVAPPPAASNEPPKAPQTMFCMRYSLEAALRLANASNAEGCGARSR